MDKDVESHWVVKVCGELEELAGRMGRLKRYQLTHRSSYVGGTAEERLMQEQYKAMAAYAKALAGRLEYGTYSD